MIAIQQNVGDLDSQGRQFLETTFGQPRAKTSNVVIQVDDLDRVPDETTRELAHREACEIAARGRSHASALGVTEREVDEAIAEASAFVRQSQQ